MNDNQEYIKKYEMIEQIGQGGYSNVYKGKEKGGNNKLVAIKEIFLKNKIFSKQKRESVIANLEEEFKIMNKCSQNNNNSVKCYEYFISEKYFTIIMEYCDSNLSELLEKKKKLDLKEIIYIMEQLNNGTTRD